MTPPAATETPARAGAPKARQAPEPSIGHGSTHGLVRSMGCLTGENLLHSVKAPG
jgi:hypothetical protein